MHFINIKQSGGVFDPGYVVYEPMAYANTEPAATTESASSSSSNKDLTDKDLLEMLGKLDGLPSDMAVITKDLRKFYINQSLGVSGSSTSNIAMRYLSILNKMKVANYNKNEYDNAYKHASEKGGLNEYAITDRGLFVCSNEEGEFKFLTAEQLKEDWEKEADERKYNPMTNSELLYYRAQDISLANQNNILSVVQNAIGMDTVTSMIQGITTKLGSDEVSEEGYASTKAGRLISGLEDFQRAVQEAAASGTDCDITVNDLYKYKFLTKDQASKANEAIKYIYNTLPSNAKSLLKIKSDLTEEGALELISALVTSSTSTKQQFDLTLEGGPTKQKATTTSATKEKDETDMYSSQLVEMVKGRSGMDTTVKIDRGDGIEIITTGRNFPLITGLDGKPLNENMSLGDMLAKSGIQGIAYTSAITMGDQIVSPDKLADITYNNTGVTRVLLPKKSDGTVDFSRMQAYEEAEKEIDSLGDNVTAEEMQEIFSTYGLSDLVKADGSLNENKIGAFLVVEGYTTDALSGIKPSKFVHEIDKWNSKNEIAIIQSSLSSNDGSGKKKKGKVPVDRKQWYNPFDMFGWYDKVLHGMIYIPITNNVQLAARIDGQKIDYDTEAAEYERQYQDFDKMLNMRSTSVDVFDE